MHGPCGWTRSTYTSTQYALPPSLCVYVASMRCIHAARSRYGQEGWSGKLKHFYSSTLASKWTNGGFAMNHSVDPLAFDHTGQNSPGAQYDAEAKLWYLFYTGATPEGTTGYPPRPGGSPMDNLSAQGVAVSKSPFGPWQRLGIVAAGGLGWGAVNV